MYKIGKFRLCVVVWLVMILVSVSAVPMIGFVSSEEEYDGEWVTPGQGNVIPIAAGGDPLTHAGENPTPLAPPPAPGPLDIIHTENFNHGGAIPPGWVTWSDGPDIRPWWMAQNAGPDYMAIASSAIVGYDITEWLYNDLAPIDCTGYGYLQMEFQLGYNYNDGDEWAQVMYSNSSVYPWFYPLQTWVTDTFGVQTLDLSMNDGDSQVYICFRYHGTEDQYMYVDDLVVTGYTYIDLVADWVEGPTTCEVGSQITVERGITNTGSDNSGTFSYRLFLSDDNIITLADNLLYGGIVADILPGETNYWEIVHTLSTVYVGTYYYGIVVDYLDEVSENNENNNWVASNTTVTIDDAYEENDFIPSAYAPFNEQIWLNTIDGLGYLVDNDFYEIYMTTNYMRLIVDCQFTHADGNIGIGVYDPTGYLVTWENTGTDDEYIDFVLPDDGTFYIIVYGANAGNSYNLWWDDLPSSTIDVEAVSVSGPAAATEGETIAIDYEMRNNGNLDSGVFRYGFYLSEDWTITTADTEIYSNNYVGVNAGATVSGTLPSVTLPAGMMGIYYYGFITDIWGVLAENNEMNNDTASFSTVTIDDHYEENDLLSTPYDISLNEVTWLSTINGFGCQADNDYYEIFMTTGFLQLDVSCLFTHADGNIGIAAYTSTGYLIDYANSFTDNEVLSVVAPNAGKIILMVYGANAGNTYNLWWDDTASPLYVDLVGTSVFGPANANEGEAISVNRSIYNAGNTGATMIEYTLYLSTNDIISTGDIEVSTRTLLDLPAATTDTRDVPATLPAGVIGRYYYGMIVDKDNLITENNLTNNDVASVGTVLIDDAYEENDDQATAYDISSNEVTWLDTIDGYGLHADEDYYEIDITPGFEYLIVDVLFTHALGDIGIAVYNSTGVLIAWENSVTDNEHLEYSLPESGTHYLRVYGAFGENIYNLWWDDLPATIDLVADSVGGTIYTTAGATIDIDRSFTNTGNTDSGTFTYGLYLSTDNTITTGDTLIYSTTYDILAGFTSIFTVPVTLPADVIGRYYYGLILDINSEIPEINEGNNWVSSLGTVFIDDAYEENDASGAAYDIFNDEQTWLSTIDGYGLQADNDWFRIYLNPGFEYLIVNLTFWDVLGNIDLEVYNETFVLLATGYSTTDNEYIATTLPADGWYYLRIFGDNAENQYDLWWDDIAPTVDLVADSVSGPAMCNEGDGILVNRVFSNTGNTASVPFTYELYLSDDAVITTGDILIHTMPRGPVQPGGVSSGDSAVTLPAGVIGTYYFGLIVDVNNDVVEINEANNAVASLGTVFIDDAYEDNEDLASAYDLTSWEGPWLSGFDGFALQADDDFYLIDISTGFERLEVNVTFTHAQGDIDLEVLDNTGKVVAGSYSSTDDENLEVVLPSSGQYYLKVFFSNAGNQYDLRWNDRLPPDTATATGPISVAPTNIDVVDITYTTTYNPPWVRLYYTTDTSEPYIWTLAGSDPTPDGSFIWIIPTDGMYSWYAASEEEVPPSFSDAPEASPYNYDGTAPWVTSTTPADGATGISTAPGTFTIYFNEDMVPIPEPVTNLPGISWFWASFTELQGSYGALNPQTVYYINLTGEGFVDMAYNLITGDQYFEFTTASVIDISDAMSSDDWILISFPNQIEGDPLTLIVDILDDGAGGFVTWDMVQWFDPQTQEWQSTASFKPPSMNTFNYVNNTMAFWIHISDYAADGLLNFGGPVARSGETVNMFFTAGWNLVGCPFPTAQPASNTFGLAANLDDMYTYDFTDPYRLRTFDWLIEDHEPGHGYWAHFASDEMVVWTCP